MLQDLNDVDSRPNLGEITPAPETIINCEFHGDGCQ
jgi:hypothetical protein